MVWRTLAVLMVAACVAAACTPSEDLIQAAYFKSDERHRVLAYHSEESLTPGQARALLKNVAWTEGTLTAAYLYEDGDAIPREAISSASDYLAAMRITERPPYNVWYCRLVIAPTGGRTYDGHCIHYRP
ncbi:MAG: hypothetical protein AAGD34_13520 [Pseudomonadota bacterium]